MKTAFLNVEWVNFYLFSSELVHSTLLQFFLGYSPCITLVKKYVTFRGRPLQMDFFQLRSFDDPSHQYNQLNKIWHWLGIGMYSQTKLKMLSIFFLGFTVLYFLFKVVWNQLPTACQFISNAYAPRAIRSYIKVLSRKRFNCLPCS